MEHDLTGSLVEQVREAASDGVALEIRGGGTKTFLGREVRHRVLDVSGHRAVLSYEPTELVLTARAGTPLREVEACLAARSQMLAFEPPHFGEGATFGGAVAAGLSGPRRPYAGAVRDFVLGVRVVNGRAQALRFGGEVMKNVAGYDLSRLLTGSMGTLAVLLDISVKVLPAPAVESTLAFELDTAGALERLGDWAGRPLPITGAFHADGILRVRLSGTLNGVGTAARRMGGEHDEEGDCWNALREQRLPFFQERGPLWRLSTPAAAPLADLDGAWLIDWGGAQRWLRTEAGPGAVREAASAAGGHAALFRGPDRNGEVFHPLAPRMLELHRRVKQAFDPHGIFNPGRMYAEL